MLLAATGIKINQWSGKDAVGGAYGASHMTLKIQSIDLKIHGHMTITNSCMQALTDMF